MPSSARSEMVNAVVERLRARGEDDDRSSEAVEAFRHVARWIPRSISPFLDLNAAMCAALPSDEPIDETDTENFDRIMKMHPNFPELISAFKQDPDAYDSFIAIMVSAMRDARAQDTNIIRYEIPKYIPLNYKEDSVTPPITGGEKSSRGFSHPAIGKLLCPLRYLHRFEYDPILFKNQVENATIKLRAIDERNWPSFLYPEGTEYDESELDKGLFRGHVFLRVLRSIFTGKSSAFTGYRSASKPSQAEMHSMREVFPEAVAYSAVQCYYGLSSLDGWDTEDRFFKLDVFFNKCVGLFTDDPEDEWVTETLKFLSSNMPALTRRAKRQVADDFEDEEGDEVVGILGQRAARRQAAREAAAHQSSTDAAEPSDNDDQHLPRPMTPPYTSRPTSPMRSRSSSPTPTPSPPPRTGARHGIQQPFSNSHFPLPERHHGPVASTSNTQQTTSGNRNSTSSSQRYQGHPPHLPSLSPTRSTTHDVEPNILAASKKNATKKTTKRRKTRRW